MSAFGDFVSLCSSGCHGTRFVDQPGRLELLEIPLPLPPESWLGGTKGGSQTTTISGTNRNTFRVLRPPANRTACEEEQYAGAKSRGGREDSESPGTQRSNSSEASSGDFLDLKGEGDISVTPVPGHMMPSSGFCGWALHRHTYRQNTHVCI
uniref:Uncharacterized protein n=1 Tax=Mus spicilegus TaxID=10103 RepID=A0A8C6GIW1_MUSSI